MQRSPGGLFGGQQERRARGDDQCVLEVSGEGLVAGAEGPAVLGGEDRSRAGGDDGFDGDDQTFIHNLAGARVGIVGNMGLLVDGTSDAVSAEFADDREAGFANLALDNLPDFEDTETGT